MYYDDPAIRQAFIAGASQAVESAILNVSAIEARELEAWLEGLADWTSGEPPAAPHHWR